MTEADERGGTDAFEATLRRLADPEAEPRPGLMHFLSDPRSEDLAVWRSVWAEMAPARRTFLARRMVEAAEADFQISFKRLFAELLDDPDPEVRRLAIEGLWEAVDVRLMRRYIALLRTDAAADVRAGAAAALGRYVELGQLDRIGAREARSALAALADAAEDESEEPEVRRRATESAGYADYADVGTLIEQAIDSHLALMRAGALRAMGNSADERWAPEVIEHLTSPIAELRFESARAAGELTLAGAVPGLVDLMSDPDREVRLEAIWALGEIGGTVARTVLEAELADADDPDVEEAIEDALASMTLSEGDMPWSDLLGAESPDWDVEPDDGDWDEEDPLR